MVIIPGAITATTVAILIPERSTLAGRITTAAIGFIDTTSIIVIIATNLRDRAKPASWLGAIPSQLLLR